MRAMDAAIVAELSKSDVQLAVLVSMDFAEGTVRVWSGVGTLTYDGDDYTGVGYLGSIGDVAESEAIIAHQITFQLSGVPSSMLSTALNSTYRGRPVHIFLAFFSAANVLIDAVLLFAGRLDTMVINEGAETSMITVSAESHLADLKRARVRRYTHADQQALYPSDRGLEYIDQIQNMEIAWGQAGGTGFVGSPPVVSSAGGTRGGARSGDAGIPGGGSGGLGDQGAPDPSGGPDPGGFGNNI